MVKKKLMKTLLLSFVLGFTVFGCSDILSGPGGAQSNAIDLTADKWTSGSIKQSYKKDDGSRSYDERWFKFNATSSTQYIYMKNGSLNEWVACLYDKDKNPIGDIESFRLPASGVSSFLRTVNSGETYYIKVWGHYFAGQDNSGSFWIGFTDFPKQPEVVIKDLPSGEWINGNIVYPNCNQVAEQWFKLTAISSPLYMHVKNGTLDRGYVRLYDKDLNPIGSEEYFSLSANEKKNISRTVSSGENYYIKVVGRYSNDNYYGTYWIALSSTGVAPY